MVSLPGFGVSGYRSFRTPQLIAPLGKVNLFAGQNNAGKSNILRFVRQFVRERPSKPTFLDMPSGTTQEAIPITLTIPVRLSDETISTFGRRRGGGSVTRAILQQLFRSAPLQLTGDELVWMRFLVDDTSNSAAWALDPNLTAEVAQALPPGVMTSLRDATLNLLGQSSSDDHENLRSIFNALGPFNNLPAVEVIEAFRQIRPGAEGEGEPNYNGVGLVRGLQRLERPTIDRHADEQRFLAVNRFLQAVLDDPTAQLKVPHDAKTIHVSRRNLTLPLENLGTGIHQVVILAAAATLLQDTVVCME